MQAFAFMGGNEGSVNHVSLKEMKVFQTCVLEGV